MMNSIMRPLATFLLTAACLLGLSACGLVDGGAEHQSPVQGITASKLRHAHLLPEASSGKFGSDSVQLIVGYSGAPTSSQVYTMNRIYRRYRIVRRYEFSSVLSGEAITVALEDLTALLDSLTSEPLVAFLEPDYEFPVHLLNNGSFTVSKQLTSWGIKDTNADDSYFRSGDGQDRRGTPDVDLYILDSGADSPDLNVVECLEFRLGAFFACPLTMDFLGHGTAVAGAAAARDNGVGLVGTAPGAPIHIIRTLNAAGYSTESRMVAAIDLVTQRKLANPSRPVVMNLSFGAYVGTSAFTAMDEAVQAAIDAGVTVVVSAGNDGKDASLYSPAHVPDAITVGAINEQERMASFSNYGPVVDLHAPGETVEVLFAGGQPNKLMRQSGTSFASPYVAGAAAVLLARNPAWTPRKVRDELVQSAQRYSSRHFPSGTTNRVLDLSPGGLLSFL